MAIGTALAIGAGVAAIGSAASAVGAHQDKQRAKGEKARAEAELEAIKKSRQEITNPYAGVEDLSGQMTNPFEYLGVATQAAEIKMEQSDIALANTLDTLAATGASAGGATALAQAALQSKKGIAASIEQQEAQNEKLRAQGEQSLNAQRIAEQQRVQSLEAAGEQFMFQAQENRTNADLDRAAGMITQAQQNIAQANQAKASSIMGGVGAVGSIGAAVAANPNFGLE